VILARFDTDTDDRTRYAVPVSELETDAEADDLIVAVVNVTVGAKVSLVIVVVASESAEGPSFAAPSATEPASKRGWIVPSVQADTVTVYDEPEPDTANEQPVAPPAFVKSPPTRPDTDSSNDNEYAVDVALLGDEAADVKDETEGGVRSTQAVKAAEDSWVIVSEANVVDAMTLKS